MMGVRIHIALVVLLALAGRAWGTEPNETFATATVLSAGILSISDALVASSSATPDTVLGVRDHFGDIYATDDDGSHLGDGTASELGGVPTNSGSIDFAISGYPDFDFDGFHSEEGPYEVFVDVYDFFDDLVAELSEVRLLQPGIVHDFFYSDSEWIGGYYDVYIDNEISVSDVDFFTFTGLTPGAAFVARTLDPAFSDIDTYLGLFDSGGALLDANDDEDETTLLSRLEGEVPANGMLTFAVTGYDDQDFVGNHNIEGTYELQLDIEGAGLPGDFNHDNIVNAADYVVWRKNPGGVYTQNDFNIWRANFGETAGAGANSAVPEPASILLIAFAVPALYRSHRRFTL